jgi:DNA-binding NarL/FixJ family response regulator
MRNNNWLNRQVPQEFQAGFQQMILKENAFLVLLGAAIGGLTHLAYHWIDWQHYQQGLFEREPSYRWLFYSNAAWWFLYGIPIHFYRNWSRIKIGDYPLAQLQWRVDASLIIYGLNILFRIAFIAQTSVMQAFANYLLLLFIFSYFYVDFKRRLLLIFGCMLLTAVLINTQFSLMAAEKLTVTIYCIIVAFFVFIFSNTWYNRVIKQFLVEKELEQQLETSRRQLTSTALIMARKQQTADLLKTEVFSLDETAPVSGLAKKKLLRIIDQAINEENEWALFQQQFEVLEPFFLQNILRDFPALTSSDLKILTLIRMNVNSKEIASILRISTQSTNTARYRLRKRLNLPEEVSLGNFVLSYVGKQAPF